MAARAHYSDETKTTVRLKYRLAVTREDKRMLARRLGVKSEHRLFNLASHLGVTRPHASTAQQWTDDAAAEYDPVTDATRLLLRDDPSAVEWTADDDRYLTEHWTTGNGKTRRLPIEDIAFFLDRTETAVAYRARGLGLRNVPKYYDTAKVASWLAVAFFKGGATDGRPGASAADVLLAALRTCGPKLGLDLLACTDMYGEMKPHAQGEGGIELVSTISLARLFIHNNAHERLVARGADRFFVRDIIESVRAIQTGKSTWEPNQWVSHGHTCLCPWSATSFRTFFNGHDEHMAAMGVDIDPRDLAPSAMVASDDWRRGYCRELPRRARETVGAERASGTLIAA